MKKEKYTVDYEELSSHNAGFYSQFTNIWLETRELIFYFVITDNDIPPLEEQSAKILMEKKTQSY